MIVKCVLGRREEGGKPFCSLLSEIMEPCFNNSVVMEQKTVAEKPEADDLKMTLSLTSAVNQIIYV